MTKNVFSIVAAAAVLVGLTAQATLAENKMAPAKSSSGTSKAHKSRGAEKAPAFNAAKEMAGFDVDKLYPVLRYEDERGSWSECLTDPTKLMRCLQQGGTLAPTGVQALLARGQLADAAADGVGAVQRWLDESRRERALALWPAYIGTSLR